MNTHEEYVTFAQAQALKELGFNWSCRYVATPEDAPDDQYWTTQVKSELNSNLRSRYFTIPTQAVACRWLREEKGIVVESVYGGPRNKWRFRRWVEEGLVEYPDYPTYESALSAGIDRALELLKGGEA